MTATSLETRDRDAYSIPASPAVTLPPQARKIFKSKCYLCHGGQKIQGNFDLKKMVYRADTESDWKPIDLEGATRIKLAILAIDGKPPKMPKSSGSILNPLTREEANFIAKWTDYPFERNDRTK